MSKSKKPATVVAEPEVEAPATGAEPAEPDAPSADRTPEVVTGAAVAGGIPQVDETVVIGGIKHHPASVADGLFNTTGHGPGYGYGNPEVASGEKYPDGKAERERI